MTFARTKIQPPRQRPAYLERGAVEARLAAALLERRVVLLCAPAGYGKTSLVSHAAAHLPPGGALAWVSADAGDTLQGLLECLLAALEPFDPPWRSAPEALVLRVAESLDAERAVAAELINALDAIDVAHGVIVIDDLHRVEDPAFFRFLDRLAERLGARWTLALVSRTEPPLALARLRAADELAEFRQLQLQLARGEARALAQAAGLEEALADRVFDRTQGWPAGLRIALGAAQGGDGATLERALRGSERPMFDYLMSEVLDQLHADLADFLLRVSVLPELEAARCAEVSGRADAPSMLDEIERLGLFVDILDAPTRTLRLHDLFRDALQQRLQSRDAPAYREARRRAAATEPNPARRIALLAEVGELEEAARLAMAHVPSMIVTLGPAAAQHVIAQFPPAFRDRAPRILLLRGLLGWVHWDFVAMREHFERAAAGFAAAGDTHDEQLAAALRAHMLIALGHVEEASRVLDALAAAPLRDDVRTVTLNAQAWLAIETGRTRAVAPLLARMLDLLERAGKIDLLYQTSPPLRMPGLPGIHVPLTRHAELLLRAGGGEPTPLHPLGLLLQAWCALWRGELEASRRLRERAQREASWSGNTGAVRSHTLMLTAMAAAIDGDAATALDITARLREPHPGRPRWTNHTLAIFGARIAAACNDADALREMLRQVDQNAATLEAEGLRPYRVIEGPARAQLAWLEGRAEDAIAGWRAALEREEGIDIYGQAAETRVRLAAALAKAANLRAAAEVLAPLLDRAAAEGGPRGALLAGTALRDLSRAAWRDLLTAAQLATLRAWEAALGGASPPAPEAQGLTARELQVLERIAAGDSNKAIARALDLSLHTVKRHVANILGKVGVETRGQAAAWLSGRKE